MEPKSRPTFGELVVQLEKIRSAATCDDFSPASNGSGAACHHRSSTDDDAPLTSLALVVANDICQNNNQLASVKKCVLDDDVYLVAGSSPSEKARCHYVQGHYTTPKDKIKYLPRNITQLFNISLTSDQVADLYY